jgi:hypothetical protein
MSVDSLFEMEVPCRVCGCTDSMACDEGCSWAPTGRDHGPLLEFGPICSVCEKIVKRAMKLIDQAAEGISFNALFEALKRGKIIEENERVRLSRAILDALLRNEYTLIKGHKVLVAPKSKRGKR